MSHNARLIGELEDVPVYISSIKSPQSITGVVRGNCAREFASSAMYIVVELGGR